MYFSYNCARDEGGWLEWWYCLKTVTVRRICCTAVSVFTLRTLAIVRPPDAGRTKAALKIRFGKSNFSLRKHISSRSISTAHFMFSSSTATSTIPAFTILVKASP